MEAARLVHQIMNLQDIAAGKDAAVQRFALSINHRAARNRVKLYAHILGKLVFRYKPDGQQERVALHIFLRAGYGLHFFVHISNGNAL